MARGCVRPVDLQQHRVSNAFGKRSVRLMIRGRSAQSTWSMIVVPQAKSGSGLDSRKDLGCE